MPPGHAAVIRELVVPILRGDQIVAILGVGNKPEDYTQRDIEVARLFADLAWDIAERKRSEDRIKESERRYRSTLDSMLEGCQVIGFDWRYLYLNDIAAKHGHLPKEELLGRTMMECYPGIEKTEMFDCLKRCMEQRIPHKMENEFAFPDGSTGWFELSIEPVPEGIFVLSIDITERKRSEEALHKSNRELRTLSACNQILVRAAEERELLQEICKILVDIGGLRKRLS
jgi:PAS domain S-box-containing protein